jgi:uncharacterized membrane protein YgaE (UPF0421/DUF939 family)
MSPRGNLTVRFERLAASGRSILQIVLAATAAWLFATEVLEHESPFFAPVAAVVTLGLTTGQRTRRAVEIGVGVTLGILVGDLLVLAVGTGTLQLAAVLAVGMVLAILLGSSPLFVQQSAVSAALVVTIQPPDGGFEFSRSLDALTGSGFALLMHLLILPVDPLKEVRRTARPLLDELADTLEDVASALVSLNVADAEAALLRARSIDEQESAFLEAVTAGRETARMAPPRRRAREPMDMYADAAAQIDLAVRNTRVLARGAARAIRYGDHIPPDIAGAVRDLAVAARAVGPALADRDERGMLAVREPALRAAASATVVLEQTGNLSVASMVSQVRAAAVDLLRSTGLDGGEATEAVRAAAREAAAAAEAAEPA